MAKKRLDSQTMPSKGAGVDGRAGAEFAGGAGPANGVSALVKSSARTLDILDLLADYSAGLTLTEMRRNLNIPISSLHGLLTTMLQRGYLLAEETSGFYRLGPKLLRLGAAYDSHVNLIALADPAMVRLRRATQMTISLTIRHGDMIVFVHKQATDRAVQVVNPVGTVLPAHATGSGKCMLAWLPEEEIDYIYPDEQLPQSTPHTINSKARLKSELALTRERGYAFDDQESRLGVWAVGACIRDAQGRPVAAISIAGPVFMLEESHPADWAALLVREVDGLDGIVGLAGRGTGPGNRREREEVP